MNHIKHYTHLINSRSLLKRDKSTGNYHVHHIYPKSLGGDNSINNLILLTPKEHFIAHHLLAYIYPHKMTYAYHRMTTGPKGHKVSSRQYQTSSLMISERMKKNNPMNNPNTISKMKNSIVNRTDVQKQQISNQCRLRQLNKPLPQSAKEKLSKFWTGKSRPRSKSHTKNHQKSLQTRWYITPKGKFISASEAGRSHDLASATINSRCFTNCDKIIKNHRSLTNKSWIGKTWREVGFYTESL